MFSLIFSKECFKANWVAHKLLHDETNQNSGKIDLPRGTFTYGQESLAAGITGNTRELYSKDFHLRVFTTFKFTGPLRPWPQTLPRAVPDHISSPKYASHPQGVCKREERVTPGSSVPIWCEADIDKIRSACKLARAALDKAHGLVSQGITTDEIDHIIHEFITSSGGYPSPLNYYRFPKSICTSVNEVICHGIPNLRPLESGDIINIDITVYYNGMHGDLNETYVVPDAKAAENSRDIELIETCYSGLMEAIKICKPGVFYRKIGAVISDTVESKRFSVNPTYCGHGIGDLFHTAPNVPHSRLNKARGIMQVGHVFTIEPMVNSGASMDKTWPDGWTAATVDGKRSAQFEHQIVITPHGNEIACARISLRLRNSYV